MKKVSKYTQKTSIKNLLNYIEPAKYTKQTLAAIVRCFLETIIENRQPAVVLARFKNPKTFEGMINRLKYSESSLYTYSENIEGFNHIIANHIGLENDEFLVIIAERFSACIYWNELTEDSLGFCESYCSMNPQDVKTIIDFLQEVAYDKNLENDLSKTLQDRRNNEKFTIILQKLVKNLENQQRDLLCTNAELNDLSQKVADEEKNVNTAQLYSTIAHEIRNPLSLINLHSRIISKNIEKLNVENKEVLESLINSVSSINIASQSLDKLLTELIDYSKPMSLEKKERNLEKTLLEVLNLIKPSFEANNVKLCFENKINNDYEVVFDSAKIFQGFLNIVKNALEISKSGDSVKIIVDYNNEKERILIKISDEGPGISPENKEKIFTPYFTTKKNGTGLGLARSKKIMEAHGGNLLINSTGDKGTTFIMSLPVGLIY